LTFSGRAAAAVPPASLLDFRTFDLPNGSPAELRQIIAQELEDSDSGTGAAAGTGPCEFAFWKTGAGGGPAAGPVSVSVLAASQGRATEIAERLFAAGVECEVLDAPPFALARAVRLAAPQQSERPQAALDWGFNSVVFTLVVDGRPAYTRAFRDCGLRHLLDSVAGGLGLSPTESRQILSSCGVPVPRNGAVSGRVESAVGELAAPVLNRLVGELRRTIGFLKQQPGPSLERIWLCGGGGLIRNVAARLTGEVGVPTQVWRLHRAPGDERPDDPAECLFAAAVALSALRWENAR
jgi:Tfp pilus assembly PilM family ATPase